MGKSKFKKKENWNQSIKDNLISNINLVEEFVNVYKNTYQHGGVSLEEMLIPIVTLKSKRN